MDSGTSSSEDEPMGSGEEDDNKGIRTFLSSFVLIEDLEKNVFSKEKRLSKIQLLLEELKCGYETEEEVIRTENLVSFCYWIVGENDKAFEYCGKVLQKEEENMIALANKANFYWKDENKRKAKEIIFTLKKLEKSEWLKARAEAEIAYEFSRFGPGLQMKAIERFRLVLQKYLTNDLWKFGLALMLRRQSHFTSARDMSDEIIKSNYKEAALLFFQICNNENGLKSIRAKAFCELGNVLSAFPCLFPNSGDMRSDIRELRPQQCFEKALQLCPDDVYVLEKCGKQFRYLSKTPSQRDLLLRSKELLEKSLGIRKTVFAYHHLGLTMKAIVNRDQINKSKARSKYPQRYFDSTNYSPSNTTHAKDGRSQMRNSPEKNSRPVDSLEDAFARISLQEPETDSGSQQPTCDETTVKDSNGNTVDSENTGDSFLDSGFHSQSHYSTERSGHYSEYRKQATEFSFRGQRAHSRSDDRYTESRYTPPFDINRDRGRGRRRGSGRYISQDANNGRGPNPPHEPKHDETASHSYSGNTFHMQTTDESFCDSGYETLYSRHSKRRDGNYTESYMPLDRGRGRSRARYHGGQQYSYQSNRGQHSPSTRISRGARRGPRSGNGSQSKSPLKAMVKSPKKMYTYPGNQDLLKAIEYIEKAVELQNGLFVVGVYDIGLLYRALDEKEKAMDTFKKITKENGELRKHAETMTLINAYEQQGIIKLEMAEQGGDGEAVEELKVEGQGLLLKAIKLSAKTIASFPSLVQAWEAFPTLKVLLTGNKTQKNIKELARLHELLGYYREAIDFLKQIYESDDSSDSTKTRALQKIVENYMKANDFENAEIFLDLLRCTGDATRLPKNLYFDTYLQGAMQSSRECQTENMKSRFNAAYRVCRRTNAPHEETDTQECDNFDVLILKSSENVPSVDLRDILQNNCGLKVTSGIEDALPGTREINYILKMLNLCSCVLFVLHEAIPNDYYFDLAIKNVKQKIIVVNYAGNKVLEKFRPFPELRYPERTEMTYAAGWTEEFLRHVFSTCSSAQK